jgi:hypothetical protein
MKTIRQSWLIGCGMPGATPSLTGNSCTGATANTLTTGNNPGSVGYQQIATGTPINSSIEAYNLQQQIARVLAGFQ